MLSCIIYRKRLGAYLDGELSGRAPGSIERHLSGCGSCRKALSDLRGLAPLLHALEVPPAPATLTSRIMAEAYERKRRVRTIRLGREKMTPRFRVLKSATAAALFFGLTLGAYMGWTSCPDAGLFPPDNRATSKEPIEERLFAIDVLGAAPSGSIEAAVLALFDDGR